MRTSRIITTLLSASALALALAGCGDDGAATEAAGSPVTIAEIRHGVDYYGACGNEVLRDGDLTLYPLLPEDLDALDLAGYPTDLDAQGLAPLRVAEPGPGDDVGTLLVYDDGMAYFASDSGDLLIWLTDEPQTYGWEC